MLVCVIQPDNEAVEFVETQIKPMIRYTVSSNRLDDGRRPCMITQPCHCRLPVLSSCTGGLLLKRDD